MFRAEDGEVTHLYAVIAEGQGVIAMRGKNGEPMPLVTYSPRIAQNFRGLLEGLATQAGVPIAFVTATVNDIEIVQP